MRRILVLALAAGAATVALTFAPARAERASSPTPRPSTTVTADASPKPSPSATLAKTSSGFLGGVVGRAIAGFFRQIVISAIKPVFDLLGRTILSTPYVTDQGRVRDLWAITAVIANASIGLFVIAGAGVITFSHRFTAQRTAREMLPRLFVAGTLVNASLIVIRVLIDISNGMSRSLLGGSLADGLPQQLSASIAGAISHGLFLTLFALAVVVLGIIVLTAYILRLLVLLIAVVAAPLFLVAHALPQTEDWARLWWRVMCAVLMIPVAQSLLFALAARVVLSQPLTGFPAAGAFIDLLMLAGVLFLAFKIPFFVLLKALSAPTSSPWRRMHAEVMGLASKTGAP